jgi:hypothetical protein
LWNPHHFSGLSMFLNSNLGLLYVLVSEKQSICTYLCNCTELISFRWDYVFMAFERCLVIIFLLNAVCIMTLLHCVSLCLQTS